MNAPRSGCPINLTGSLRAIRLHTPQAFRQTHPSALAMEAPLQLPSSQARLRPQAHRRPIALTKSCPSRLTISTLTAVRRRASTTRWRLPAASPSPGGLRPTPRSVEFGPVAGPPFSPTHAGRLDAGPRPVDLVGVAQASQEFVLEPPPDPSPLPVAPAHGLPAPTGGAAAAAELAHEIASRRAGAAHEQDAGQRRAIRPPGAAAPRMRGRRGQQGLKDRPPLVRNHLHT
jgi:hypothetical protein